MTAFHYVYVLQSLSHPDEIYTGITADLKRRLGWHNAGKSPAHFQIHCLGNSGGDRI